jgi:hypothetical protein
MEKKGKQNKKGGLVTKEEFKKWKGGWKKK